MSKHIVPSIFLCWLFGCMVSCMPFGNNQIHPDFAWVNDSLVSQNSTELVQSVPGTHTIDITRADWVKFISLKEIVASIEAVALETPAGYEIGHIDKLQLINDTIFLLDRRKSRNLYMFSRTGVFMGCVGSRGQGPGEFSEPTDFDVCGDTIYVLDQYKAKLHLFDRQANYISTRNLPFIATGISVPVDTVLFFNHIDADNYHLHDLINYSVYKTNQRAEIVGHGFRREHGKYPNLWMPSNFYRTGDLTYYHPAYSPDIFTINPNGDINKKYHVDFGKYALPDEYILRDRYDDLQKAEDGDDYHIFSGDFYEAGNWVYFNFAKKHRVHHVFANESGRVFVTPTNLVDDLKYNLPLGKICGVEGNTLISALDPFQLIPGFKDASEEVRRSALTPAGYELCSKLDEEDNPVLFFCTLKESI